MIPIGDTYLNHDYGRKLLNNLEPCFVFPGTTLGLGQLLLFAGKGYVEANEANGLFDQHRHNEGDILK